MRLVSCQGLVRVALDNDILYHVNKKYYNIKCQGLVRVALAKVRIRKGPPAVAQKTSQIKGEVKLKSTFKNHSKAPKVAVEGK